MLLNLPKEQSFYVPEGHYRAILRDIREVRSHKKHESEDQLRFVFELLCPVEDRKVYWAGKNYAPTLSYESDLYQDLNSWLGGNWNSILTPDDRINPDLLKGRIADLVIRNISNTGFAHPFSFIKGVFPPNTLTLSTDCEEWFLNHAAA